MPASSRKILRGAVATVAVFAVTTAMSARARETSAPVQRSSAPDWNHIRLIGEKLGLPRTILLGAPPAPSVGIGDFDDDGDADIIVGTNGAREVLVLLGDQRRPFGSVIEVARPYWPAVDAVAELDGVTYFAHSTAIASVTTVQSRTQTAQRADGSLAVVADFNGDGAADVVPLPAGSAELLVYLGGNNGGWRAAGRVGLNAAAAAAASGDFNGDGTTDLVVADGRSTAVTLLFGNGSGGFASSRLVDVGLSAVSHGIAAADIDGDGATDLVVLGHGQVNVFLGGRSGVLLAYASAAVDMSRPSTSAPQSEPLSSETDAYQGVAALTLNPATIAGGSGATSTGTITLNAPAPTGGVVVALTSSNIELAAMVPSVTVPAGATTASFVVGTNRNYRRYSGLAFNVTISASHGAATRSAILSVGAQAPPGPLSNFDAQNEGLTCFGVGVRRTATGHTLEFGSAGNLFECTPPKDPVGQDGTCTFRQECTFGCELRPVKDGFKFSDVCAAAGPFPIAVGPKLLVGGEPSRATLQLSTPAPANSSGRLSSNTVLANTIPSLRFPIPAGATSAGVDVLTARVGAPGFAPIDGDYSTPQPDGSRGGRVGLTWMALVSGTPPPFRLTSLSIEPLSVVGGDLIFTTGQMNQVAPAPAIAVATMTVSSSNPAVVPVQNADVTFVEGSSSATLTIRTNAVAADTVVTLSAVLGDTTVSRAVTVRATPAATSVNSFFLDPLQVNGGDPSTGTVILNGAAPSGGASVGLQSGNSSVAAPPPSVTVPAGSDRVSFFVATSPVGQNTTVSLTATYNGSFAATSLMVLAAPGLASIALNPTSVVGGQQNSTGTVTLSAAAPGGGKVVTLSSSNPASASVPPSVTVAAGSTSASFTVTTSTVSASTSSTITAALEGVTRSATLTVVPASATPLPAPSLVAPAQDARFAPGQAITFDWTDVSGAASYTIQIDDADTFAAPLIASATVAASQYVNSTLPTRRMWWRVRANDAAGNPGAWSAVRRFEVK